MVKNLCHAGGLGSITGSERSPGEGNGNPLQYSCLENPMDRVAWQATVHGVTESWTQLRNTHTHTHTHTQKCNGLIEHSTVNQRHDHAVSYLWP